MRNALLITMLFGMASDAVADAGDCVTVETSISGSSLQGQLWQGQAITVYGKGCGQPERYDYVVFRASDSTPQIIKQLWGLPGDTLAVQTNGRFHINGVEAKTPFGRPYVLLGAARTRFQKLEGVLTDYLVLGHPGSDDSARLGLIAERDILGFVPRDKAP